MGEKYDFSGYATKNDLLCADGRTIKRDAFKDSDGAIVPLVWQHMHNDPQNVLGHALLENRVDGVYMYGKFNDTEKGQDAKKLVAHGDIRALSIYANKLVQQNGDVLHGVIREVSLVLAGANPGASIEFPILAHSGEEIEDEAVIYTDESLEVMHASDAPDEPKPTEKKEDKKMADEKTVQEVFDELTEEQKNVVYYMIGKALDESDNKKEGEKTMKHNIFENDETYGEDYISHEEMSAVFADARRYGSLKDAVLAHGITNIGYMFPEDRAVSKEPTFISRDMGWVSKFMNAVHHTPFSRIKSIEANITGEDARAKGYIKGNEKTDEVFSLLKRSTAPTTIYKKQKIDRDDMIDITDFDVVAWLKKEMRMMLDEEIARAVLVGDQRLSSSDDKINEQNIRPIWTDDDLYTVKARYSVSSSATDDAKAKAFIRAVVKSRKNYKGSGNPTLYTTEDVVTDCLLMEDTTGRVIYDSVEKLATALRVKEIVTVPVMENLSHTVSGTSYSLMGIIVNPNDYNIGADKGGAVNMFDDFDIDYNAQKYLMETRCSGALVKPYSAISVEVNFQ